MSEKIKEAMVLSSTKEHLAALVNDPKHLRNLMALWPENHLIYQLAKALLEKQPPFTPAKGPKIPPMARRVVLSVKEVADD
ncbi:hypothetical protein BIY27_25080 [Gibbsiella quercinecans]|uniref:hypothetical protein n=1 Tax=Gibbsiella quercinecans TaxID=929813 RepID=UPI000EF22507|nr:hypothetical protein [Gibbsiella quercinecans]RLM02417.1 hypothetical protein BIY27_25080 [Gibbsiella quercinecans]